MLFPRFHVQAMSLLGWWVGGLVSNLAWSDSYQSFFRASHMLYVPLSLVQDFRGTPAGVFAVRYANEVFSVLSFEKLTNNI
jgi:hypothetical protein